MSPPPNVICIHECVEIKIIQYKYTAKQTRTLLLEVFNHWRNQANNKHLKINTVCTLHFLLLVLEPLCPTLQPVSTLFLQSEHGILRFTGNGKE